MLRVQTLAGDLQMAAGAVSPYIGVHQCSVLSTSGKCHK